MQWLKAFLSLVGWLIAFSFFGLIVIHHHCIYTKYNNLWHSNHQPPGKQFMKYLIENKIRNNGNFYEEPLYLMR